MTGLALMGYGPIADLQHMFTSRRSVTLLAHLKERRQRARARILQERLAYENAAEDQLRRYLPYARLLARRHHGPLASPNEVEHEALVAAWNALERYQPGPQTEAKFVRQRMLWRVLDIVRIRTHGDRAFALSTPYFDEVHSA